MPLMHEHRREVSASRSVRCSYTTCLLAYTTRESAGVRGFALFGISNTVFLFACVWSVSVVCGPCRWGYVQDRLAALRMFSHILLTTTAVMGVSAVSHICDLTSYFMFIYAPATSNCTAHGAWLQNAAMPQRPATPTLRLLLII